MYTFIIYYEDERLCTVSAHSKWQAIDKAFYSLYNYSPQINRKLFKAKRF